MIRSLGIAHSVVGSASRLSTHALFRSSAARLASVRPATVGSCPSRILSRTITTTTTPKPSFTASLSRSVSTTTATTATTTATSPTAPTTATTAANTLTWNKFLSLRRIRRRYSLFSSVTFAITTAGAGALFVLQNDYESVVANKFGLDPIFVAALLTVSFGTLGWLVGPFLGNAVFGLVYKRYMPKMSAKEQEFFARIRKHRVDPSTSSPQNPVPDYYGEKIGSVADYRRWLKDQRAFKLKRGRSIV